MRILRVEDDRMIADALGRTLRGAEGVDWARDGAGRRGLARRGRRDLPHGSLPLSGADRDRLSEPVEAGQT